MLRLILLLIFSYTLFTFDTFAKPLITAEVIHHIEHKYTGWQKRRFVAWAKLIQSNQGKPEAKKLRLVNDFFNLFEYRSDAKNVQRQDEWSTPVEFISKGGGDCEDFAIAKYFTLEALAVSTDKLRITYVKAIKFRVAHMVLTYYKTPDAMPLVLDNLIGQIKPANQRTDLLPVYSFNAKGLWLAKQRGQGRRVSGPDRISLWKDLNRRMLKELEA